MKGRTCAGNKGQMTMCKGGWPVLQSSDSRDSTLTGRSVAPISPDSAPHWVFSNHMQGQHMEPGGWECPHCSEDTELILGIWVQGAGEWEWFSSSSSFWDHPLTSSARGN